MRYGFSLVELSIVLVILGLLTGGILTGQNLIRAAELRSVTTEYAGYKTAINIFKDKYFAIPGDMRNATDFWGVAAGTGNDNTCRDDVGTGTLTCNGNSDGMINDSDGAYEAITVWRHLSNAGLIEGSYINSHAPSGLNYQAETNIPSARFGSAAWGFTNASDHVLSIGNSLPSRDGVPRAAAFEEEEAWNIDTKIDDGFPDTGKVWGEKTAEFSVPSGTCATEYSLSSSGARCYLSFLDTY